MNDETKRIESLLQDLQEIEEASTGFILCAVITSTLTSPLQNQADWEWIASLVPENRNQGGIIVFDLKPVVVEPFRDGKGCIRWCGPDTKREALKVWLARLSGVFRSNPKYVPDTEPNYGVEGGLQVLCAVAATMPELSPMVKLRSILDLNHEQAQPRKIPMQLQKVAPKLSFEALEINFSVPQFALKVLCHILSKPIDPPHVTAGIEQTQSDKINYSTAILPPMEWAFIFGHPKNARGSRQFMAAVKAGSIKTEKLTAKKLKIAIEDLPVSHPESPRYKRPTPPK